MQTKFGVLSNNSKNLAIFKLLFNYKPSPGPFLVINDVKPKKVHMLGEYFGKT